MRAGSERKGDLKSLGLLPMVTGIGHLLPAIGALQAVGGKCKEEIALLVMVASTTVLVDSHDKYKDLPPERRPRRWVWRLWVSLMTGVASTSTYMCGLYTAIRIHRFLAIGMLWGIPCMPGFSPSEGLRIYKPKAVIREAKSLVVAVCMGYVGAETSMYHVCMNGSVPCASLDLQQRSLNVSILYQFIRETVCDIRDIGEDSQEKLTTLPVLLGKRLTLILLLLVGIPVDTFLTGGITLSWAGSSINWSLAATSALRMTVTVITYLVVLRFPRDNSIVWGSSALFGLLPVLSAQLALA